MRNRSSNNSGPAPEQVSCLLPAVQWLSVECRGVQQHRFVTWRHVAMTHLRLIGQLLGDTMSCPSALQSSAPTCLTFDPSVQLSTNLVLVGGADRVPQVPVPETCQSHVIDSEFFCFASCLPVNSSYTWFPQIHRSKLKLFIIYSTDQLVQNPPGLLGPLVCSKMDQRCLSENKGKINATVKLRKYYYCHLEKEKLESGSV